MQKGGGQMMQVKRFSFETGLYVSLSLLALLAVIFALPMPSAAIQSYALIVGVVLIGLPHGALDTVVAKRLGLLSDGRRSLLFHSLYVAIAAMVVALWMLFPVFALLLFLLYSAYHFAGDWMDRPHWARLLIGAAILSLPAMEHMSAVADIYAVLSGETAKDIAYQQSKLAPLWLALVGLTAGLWLRNGKYSSALELLCVCLTAVALPPLIFFLLYFCGLHSPRHFLRIWRASSNPHKTARIAAIYTVATVILALPVALHFGHNTDIVATVQRVIFIGLAALSVPHMLLISVAEKNRHD